MKILFVCTGNTCRSAMAEGIMSKLVSDKGIDIEISSRGIYASNDSSATPEAINVLQNLYGIDISHHYSARLTYNDIETSDMVFAMTENHRNLILMTIEDDTQAQKIRIFAEEDINDPYMGSRKEYETCAKQLYEGVNKILTQFLSH